MLMDFCRLCVLFENKYLCCYKAGRAASELRIEYYSKSMCNGKNQQDSLFTVSINYWECLDENKKVLEKGVPKLFACAGLFSLKTVKLKKKI